MQTLSNILKWIFVSSANPEQWSATVKFALLGVVPTIMTAVGLACGVHLACVPVTAGDLQSLATEASQLVFLALSAVSIVGSAYGLIRKIYRTATGTNAAFAPSDLG